MSLNADDIAAVLTKSAGFDSAHTPRASAILTAAWLEHFATYAPSATRADLLSAVSVYHREPHDRMLQPGDLSIVIRARRQDELDRTNPDERALPAGAQNVGELPDYPSEWSPDERLTAYWHMVKTRTARPVKTENWWTLLRAARAKDSA